MSVIIGIDIGGSTTKITALKDGVLLRPSAVKATDPLASVYGAFGKYTSENRIPISGIERVAVTGVGSAFLTDDIYGLPTHHINEFMATGKGGLYLTGLVRAVIVSMGTGTAMIYAHEGVAEHLGGTGVGGGTLIGLSRKMLGMSSADEIAALAAGGSLENIDLTIEAMTKKDISPNLTAKTTASNFGNLKETAGREDIALGIINLVYETAGMMAIFSARQKSVTDIVLTGNLSVLPQAKDKFRSLSEMFGVKFIIPDMSQYATVIGAALTAKEN
ncbi:MAG: BadF/BadG/BcrA/BcrD ATPase family protein [Clostridiales bacterium]|nr:BadF/BadG/BcrA/BcrD ATPase family protein [Clostridiales bacterium]